MSDTEYSDKARRHEAISAIGFVLIFIGCGLFLLVPRVADTPDWLSPVSLILILPGLLAFIVGSRGFAIETGQQVAPVIWKHFRQFLRIGVESTS